jgi:hypothetical protein
METDSIIQVVKAIFSGTDKRNWSEIKNAMAEEVLLDYSSMTGKPAVRIIRYLILRSLK